jgi:hypothetical protein
MEKTRQVFIEPLYIGIQYNKASFREKVGKILKTGTYEVKASDTVVVHDLNAKEKVMEELYILLDDASLIRLTNIKYKYSPDSFKVDSLDLNYGSNYHDAMIKPEIKRSVQYSLRELKVKKNDTFDINMLNLRLAENAGREINKRYGYLQFISVESYQWLP